MKKEKTYHFERLEVRRLINKLGEGMSFNKLEPIILEELTNLEKFIEGLS
jgi:hypothetical protein